MSLINCPECGRENVSESAESCPSCGYGIKAHFEQLQNKELSKTRQQQQIERREREKQKFEEEVEAKFQEYVDKMALEMVKIESVTKPKRPSYFAYLFSKEVRFLTYLIVVGPLVTLLFCKLAEIDAFILILYAALGLIATPIWLIFAYIAHRESLAKYKEEINLYNSNRVEWEKQREQQIDNIEQYYRARARIEIENRYNPPSYQTSNQLKCPICNSTNVERITTFDRSFSVAMVGLASNKIGKQYKCKNCKHMW